MSPSLFLHVLGNISILLSAVIITTSEFLSSQLPQELGVDAATKVRSSIKNNKQKSLPTKLLEFQTFKYHPPIQTIHSCLSNSSTQETTAHTPLHSLCQGVAFFAIDLPVQQL